MTLILPQPVRIFMPFSFLIRIHPGPPSTCLCFYPILPWLFISAASFHFYWLCPPCETIVPSISTQQGLFPLCYCSQPCLLRPLTNSTSSATSPLVSVPGFCSHSLPTFSLSTLSEHHSYLLCWAPAQIASVSPRALTPHPPFCSMLPTFSALAVFPSVSPSPHLIPYENCGSEIKFLRVKISIVWVLTEASYHHIHGMTIEEEGEGKILFDSVKLLVHCILAIITHQF